MNFIHATPYIYSNILVSFNVLPCDFLMGGEFEQGKPRGRSVLV